MTQLKDVVVNQVQLAMAEGNYKHNGIEKCILVVVVPDATPLWNTIVSKADGFVHVWGGGRESCWTRCPLGNVVVHGRAGLC